MPDTPRYFVRRGILPADSVGNRRGETIDLIHDRGNGADIVDRLLLRRLHLGNLGGNVLGRLGGLGGERLDFRGDHGKSPTRLAGARGFDRGVERQQIGLTGNVADKAHDLIDMLRGGGEGPNSVSLAVPAIPEARCTIVVASLTCVLIACTELPSWLAAVATV